MVHGMVHCYGTWYDTLVHGTVQWYMVWYIGTWYGTMVWYNMLQQWYNNSTAILSTVVKNYRSNFCSKI